jgi:putative intracellular protease/amidase
MSTVLIPLPSHDFDPTETGVPWRLLRAQGHRVVFATPDGRAGAADPKMVTGEGLGILAPLLKADANGRDGYAEMTLAAEFQKPISYGEIAVTDYDGLLLAGGHAPGMRPYLESAWLQTTVGEFFERDKPVGAICHGVLLAARSRDKQGQSLLAGRKTTALTRSMELTAWMLTRLYLGDYYRTYPVTVEDEVRGALSKAGVFIPGPMAVRRDSLSRLDIGFTVRDGNFLSARWPGDAHRFGSEFGAMLRQRQSQAA